MAKIDVKGASITVCSDGGKDYRLHAARIRQPHAGRGLSRQRLRGEPVGRQIGEISRPVIQVGSLPSQGVADRLRPCPAGGDFSPKPTLSGRCPRKPPFAWLLDFSQARGSLPSAADVGHRLPELSV